MEKNFCAVHGGNGVEVRHSLALRRGKDRKWEATPVCLKCCKRLLQEARAKGIFVPFYALEASQKEAAKRNEEGLKFSPFLERFGKKEKPKPAKVKVVSKPGTK